MRYNIALLIDSIYDEYDNKLWYELVEQAKNFNINLISLVGGAIHSPFEQNPKRNVIYKFVSPGNVDGIISFSASIGSFATMEEIESFLSQFSPVPIVNIGISVKNYPSILINNEDGMFQLMKHLIDVHHYQRIAFIKGPVGNAEADLRYKVYQQVLEEKGLPLDESIVVEGDFCRISGSRAVSILLDERNAAFDVVVAANDYMAIDAMKELQNRGTRIPEDIAVTGFDDLHESSCLLHPLTTVKQPIYDIAKNAMEMIINIVEKKEVRDRIILPAKTVIRRSCGCFIDVENKKARQDSYSIRNILIEEMDKNLTESLDKELKKEWSHRLISDFEHSLKHKNQKSFLIGLEDVLIHSTHKGVNILTWYPIISTLFSNARDMCKEKDFFNLLWKGALIVVGNLAKHAQAHIQIFKSLQNYQLHLLSEAFRNIFDAEKQKLFMNKYLPELDIMSFYLGLFPSQEELDHLNLLLIYEEGQYVHSPPNRVSLHELLHRALYTIEKQKILVLYSIYSDREQLGIAIIEDGPQDGIIYETIGAQLNLSIYEAKLLETVQKHAEELEHEVKARTMELEVINNELMAKNTKIMKLNKELELKSKLDGLTNIYNRTAIYEFLKNQLPSYSAGHWINTKRKHVDMRRSGDCLKKSSAETDKKARFSIMMMDLDHFKQINDTYGHLFGDKVLKVMSSLLQTDEIFRKDDIAGRYGGEEFIVILPDTGTNHARTVASRFKERLTALDIEYNDEIHVHISISIGIAEFNSGDQDYESVIHRADMALYYAKKHGRNRVICYDDVF